MKIDDVMKLPNGDKWYSDTFSGKIILCGDPYENFFNKDGQKNVKVIKSICY